MYTEMMLQYTPVGVRYHHYEDLMALGQVRKNKWLYRIGPRLAKYGILPPDLWAEYLDCDFVPDLLHIHGFSAKVRFPKSAKHVPVILNVGSGGYHDLRYYLGWGSRRIEIARWIKRQYLRIIDAHDSSLRPEGVSKVLVFSEFSRRIHLDEGYVDPEQVEVLYPGQPWRGDNRCTSERDNSITFLFVGREFERKNGPLVLDAFRRVRSKFPAVRLMLIGIPADGRTIQEPGVIHYQFLPRDDLMRDIYPQANVLILPSRAEGFGLVLLEAMSFGMPVIAANAYAMKEIVEEGVNGFLVDGDEIDDLVDSMAMIAGSGDLQAHLQEGAKKIFQERFSISVYRQRLGRVYQEVLDESTSGN